MAMQTVASKLVTVFGQVLLAWLLTDTDFGVIALAYTAAAFPAQINQVGLKEVLVRRSKNYHLWASSAHWLALGFGLLTGLTMLVIAFPAAHIFKSSQLVGLIAVIALSAPIELLSQVVIIKLQIELRFRAFAIIAFVLAVAQIALSVIFARLGAGPYSFVIPTPIVAAIRLGIGWTMVRPPFNRRIDFRRCRYLVGDSLLMLAARMFGAVIIIGDYLSLGFFHQKPIVGIYYFAYNLSLQTIIFFAMNLEGVLFPTLSRLSEDLPRQRQGFLNAARVLAVVAIPACLLQAALTAPLIHAIFPAKWFPSIPVLEILCIGMAFRSVGYPSFSLMQAQGRFKTLSKFAGVGAAIFLSLTLTASRLSDDATAAVRVAQVVALYFAAEAPIAMFMAIRRAGGTWLEVWRVYFIPFLLSAIACGVAWFALRFLPARSRLEHVWQILAGALIAAALYLPAIRIFAPDAWSTLMTRARLIVKRSAA